MCLGLPLTYKSFNPDKTYKIFLSVLFAIIRPLPSLTLNQMLKKPSSFLSIIAWKQRLVFWVGAIFVGLVIVIMTLLSEWAAQTYRTLSLHYPWFNFVIPPIGLGFTA